VYICIYIYIYIYMYIYTCIYVCVYVCIYICICMYVCVYIYICVCVFKKKNFIFKYFTSVDYYKKQYILASPDLRMVLSVGVSSIRGVAVLSRSSVAWALQVRCGCLDEANPRFCVLGMRSAAAERSRWARSFQDHNSLMSPAQRHPSKSRLTWFYFSFHFTLWYGK